MKSKPPHQKNHPSLYGEPQMNFANYTSPTYGVGIAKPPTSFNSRGQTMRFKHIFIRVHKDKGSKLKQI